MATQLFEIHQEELLCAATIASLKHVKLDKNTAAKLKEVNSRFLGCKLEPYKKKLTKTDVEAGQGRLSITNNYGEKHLSGFLKDVDAVNGLKVDVYDPEGRVYVMTLKFWAKKYYVLTSGWNIFRRDHDLKNGDLVTLYGYRRMKTQKLYFVIEPEKAVPKIGTR